MRFRRLAGAVAALLLPLVPWALIVVWLRVMPHAARYLAFVDLLLVGAAALAGFRLATRTLRLPIAVGIGFVYFPALYVALAYLELLIDSSFGRSL